MTRYEIYCLILETGLLNIRQAASRGDVAQCFAESDHLHNMPALLMDLDNSELQHFYSGTMRSSYLSISKPEWRLRFAKLWEALDRLDCRKEEASNAAEAPKG